MGTLGGIVNEGQKVLGLGAHGRPYRIDSDNEEEQDVWAQVMPHTDHGLESRVAKGGHGVPLSGKSPMLRSSVDADGKTT
jgi:hypothetical protein